jgi:hypothetical protein
MTIFDEGDVRIETVPRQEGPSLPISVGFETDVLGTRNLLPLHVTMKFSMLRSLQHASIISPRERPAHSQTEGSQQTYRRHSC